MSEIKQFRLPDVGEGLTEAEIVSWKVKPGDTVRVNDIVVEIETAKSLVELPSPFAGTVIELMADEGDTVAVGSPIIRVDTAGGRTAPTPQPAPLQAPGTTVPRPPDDMTAGIVARVPAPAEDAAVEPGLIGGPAPGGRTSVLVGYGPRTTEAKRRPRKGAGGATPSTPEGAVAQEAVQTAMEPAPAPTPLPPVEEAPEAAPSEPLAPRPTARVHVLAKPPVRKLARDLGVDLSGVTPSGAGGVITRADVEAAAAAATPSPGQPVAPAGRETRIPVKGVRKATAQAMVTSAFTAPHVTEWLTLDVTRTMRLVDRMRGAREFEGIKLSPLHLVAKALLLAVRRHPDVNASWDDDAQEIVVKHDVNLGFAAATPRGLLVPNVKRAHEMSLVELAREMCRLADAAREGRTPPQDMQGGTITITNVGVFGVDGGTPIINPGEAAILCLGAVREQPWVHKGKVRPRLVTQLALSFDHRLIDGELGSRFLADIARVLTDPAQALAWT